MCFLGAPERSASVHVRRVAPINDPEAPVDVCLQLDVAVEVDQVPIAVPLQDNGYDNVACEESYTSEGAGQVRWALEKEAKVECSRGWRP